MKKIAGILLTFIMLVNLLPTAFASGKTYTIDEVYFSNLSGKVMQNPGTSCVVNVKVTKQAERLGEDVVVIATYATDGSMIGFTTVAGTMTKGKTETFSTLVVSPTEKNIGVVKAYMWNNISEMKPLSTVNQTIVNEMDEGIELPPISEEPIKPLYIPTTVTVNGMIIATPNSDSALSNGEYMLGNAYIPLDFSNIYTAEEYDLYLKRMNAIGNYYGIPVEGDIISSITVVSALDLSGYLYASGEFTLKINNKNELEVVNFEVISFDEDKPDDDVSTFFTETSRFAVIKKAAALGKTEDGTVCYEVAVLYDGEEQVPEFNNDPSATLAVGDAFFFVLDNDGLVMRFYEVFDKVTDTYSDFAAAGVPASMYEAGLSAPGGSTGGWNFNLADDGSDIQLVYGIVSDVKSNGIEFAVPYTVAAEPQYAGLTKVIDKNIDGYGASDRGVYYFGIADESVAYVYDTGDTNSVRESDKIQVTDAEAMAPSNFDMFETAVNSNIFDFSVPNTIVPTENPNNYANYALAMVVDGDIVAIYAITK